VADNRNSLAHKVAAGLRRPRLIARYARRVLRNWRIRRFADSHPEFYRAIMADDVKRRTARGAVGTEAPERWNAIGQKQFNYLRSHGLEPGHQLLEIGCGNLRAGRHFIEYLEPGAYTGVDISPDILLAANETIVTDGLQDRRPRLYLVSGTDMGFLPDAGFDVIHAHSVFTHTPLDVVRTYFEAAARLLRPGGFFDFTYHHTDEAPWDFLQEDYYFPTELLLTEGSAAGFKGRRLEDWVYTQSKIRLEKRAP